MVIKNPPEPEILILGCSHKTAPLAVREQFVFKEQHGEDAGKTEALRELMAEIEAERKRRSSLP